MEKLEYFTIMPNLKQFYGKTVTKDTVFDEKTENGYVTQHFEDLTLPFCQLAESNEGINDGLQ